ncbi:MAG: choice-of-anchor D domain-containing protein, partial [Terriglobales bacterium]
MKRQDSPWTCVSCALVLLNVLLFAATATGQLALNPSTVIFGSVQTGNSVSQSVVLNNTGSRNLTIFRARVSGTGFSISGLTLPLTLAPGQSASLTTAFAPQSSGSISGDVSFEYFRHERRDFESLRAATVSLTGAGTTPGQLAGNPSSLNFANVQVGSSQTQSATLTNSGNSSLTVSQATLNGTSFSLSGLALPLTLGAGQSATFSVTFAPQSMGSSSGSASITSTGSNPNLSIPLSGTGVTQGAMAANPTSLALGNVQVGSSASLSETLTNTGGTSLTISAAAASGTGFSLSGLALPVTLTAGQSTSFTVLFSPTASGAASGSISITSTGSNPNLSIPLSGTGVTQGTLTANQTSLAFGSVQIGNSTSLSETLSNTGGSSLTISAATVSGTGFSLSGLTLPVTLTARQSTSFTVLFSPTASGAASGSVSITSNASGSNLSIPLSGTGVTQGTLTANQTSLAFGSVQVGNSASLSETLSNTGGSSLTISAATASGTGFSLSGLTLPVILTAGQSTSFTVLFS